MDEILHEGGGPSSVQATDALSQETRIRNGVPQVLVTGSFIFLPFVIDILSVISVLALVYTDDVTTRTKRLFAELPLQCLEVVGKLVPLYQFHQLQLYIATGRAHPLQLFLATGSPGESIQVANIDKYLGVRMDSSFSPSIQNRKAGSKEKKRILIMIRRYFTEISMFALTPHPLHKTLVQPYLEYAMQACSPNLVADVDCLEQIQRLTTRLVKSFRRLIY